jgi:hypothetical protein
MTGLWATLVVNRRFQPVQPDVLPGGRNWVRASGLPAQEFDAQREKIRRVADYDPATYHGISV